MKIKTGWFFFFLSMVTLLPFRVYQRLFLLEINRGFPKVGDHSLEILLGVLLLFTILFVWSCSADKKAPGVYTPRPNFFAGIFALLLAASVAFESVYMFIGQGDVNVLNASKIILGVAGLIATIFILILAIDAFRGGNTFGNHPYLALLLPLWGLIRLTVNFMQFNTETGQENMFDSFALIGCLLFLYSQSRLLIGMERQRTIKSTFSFGFLSILTGFMCILPRYIGYVLENHYYMEGVTGNIFREGLTPFPTDLIFSLYVFAFLIGLYFNSYRKGKATAEMEQDFLEDSLVEKKLDHSKSAPDAVPSYYGAGTDPAAYDPASANEYYRPAADSGNLSPHQTQPPAYPEVRPYDGQDGQYGQYSPQQEEYGPGAAYDPYGQGQPPYPPQQNYPG